MSMGNKGTVGDEAASPLVAGRYELGRLIGGGGMGEIRQAHDRRLGRDVAIKFLRRDVAGSQGRERFEDEARAAARLNHPNVVTVFDSGEHDGEAYLVMELLPGDTLVDEMAIGPLDPERVREVGIAVLGALAAAHDLGIIHRDVKPGNILVAADGTPKVGDFGIAKSADSMHATSAGMVIGTPAYLAPERIEGQRATPQSDLYAVGVVLYQALAGRLPFEGEDPMGVVHAIRTADPTPVDQVRPEVDAALSDAIARAMAKDPAQRFGTAAEMAAALTGTGGATLAGDDVDEDPTVVLGATAVLPPLATAPASPGPQGPQVAASLVPPVRRRPRVRIVVALAAALVLLALVAILVSMDRGGETGTGTGTSATTGATLPPGLDDALDRLEDAVDP